MTILLRKITSLQWEDLPLSYRVYGINLKKDIIIRRQTECHLRYYSSPTVWVSGPRKGVGVDGVITETQNQTWFVSPNLEDVCNRMRDLDWIYCDDYVILKNRAVNLG